MNTASILIKTDPQLKAKAQKAAKDLGLSLTSVINRYLKHFIATKIITFSSMEEETPNAYFKKTLKKARKDWKEGKGSPIFDTGEKAVKWLEKQGI